VDEHSPLQNENGDTATGTDSGVRHGDACAGYELPVPALWRLGLPSPATPPHRRGLLGTSTVCCGRTSCGTNVLAMGVHQKAPCAAVDHGKIMFSCRCCYCQDAEKRSCRILTATCSCQTPPCTRPMPKSVAWSVAWSRDTIVPMQRPLSVRGGVLTLAENRTCAGRGPLTELQPG